MISHPVARWFLASNIKGLPALALIVAAIAIPTLVRAAISNYVTGCEFTPFLPFVLLAAIMLGWWQASLVTLASVAIVSALFAAGPLHHFFHQPCLVSATGVFLGASAAIIGVVTLIKQLFAQPLSIDANERADGVVFSLEKDQVWASWYGSSLPMRLGSRRKVGAMMKDFLAQEELADRLSGKPKPPRR